jgi:microcystin-dependent protein
MSEPYIGEIRMFAGNYAPAGWMLCNGQSLPISENDVLFQLIGTTYGGDGQQSFNLPNMQSRIPIHMGNGPDGTNYQLAEAGGVESVTLSTQQIPSHNHLVLITDAAAVASPTNASFAASTSSQAGSNAYNADEDPGTTLAPGMVGASGGSQPHDNCQPFLCVNFIISLHGIFPQPT